MRLLKVTLHGLVILILTILTQIGGILYLLSLLLFGKKTKGRKIKRLGSFTLLYLLVTYFVIPVVAPLFGRAPISEAHGVTSHFALTKLANRNYVTEELNETLKNAATELRKVYPNISLVYLDANFPFFEGFPLLPHLSHNDGKKVDLAFIYETPEKRLTNDKPSVSGYGIFEPPKENAESQTDICKSQGYWHYDFTKYTTLGTMHSDLKFAERQTRDLIQILVKQPATQKVFVEPHLKKRMGLSHNKLRFQGCSAVRHDDHIHLQIN